VGLVGSALSPFVGLLSRRTHRGLRDLWAVFVSLATLASVYLLYQHVSGLETKVLVYNLPGQSPPFSGCFEVDLLSLFMGLTISLLSLLAVVYSISYMSHEDRVSEFYTLVSFMASGMLGVVFSGDFFTFFVFWELMGLSSYVLVSFLKRNWGPIEAGFKYLVMSASAGAFLILSMALLYGLTGTLNFAAFSTLVRGAELGWVGKLLLSTLILGFGVKSAIVPLHTWLPDAHPEAPSPISALLSGVVIETGLYGLTRVLFLVFQPAQFRLPMAALAVVTMTVGNLLALLQGDIKRMLAYSSIAQIGYMLVGLASGNPMGVQGLFLHVLNHSLMKGLAFLSAGSLIHVAQTREVRELKGLGRSMPYTSLALFVSFMGLGGVPATNGFISKFTLFGAAIQAGMPWLTVLGVLNSALSMAYYLNTVRILFSEPVEEMRNREEAPILMVGVALLMMVLIVLSGVFPEPTMKLANQASKALFEGLNEYVGVVFS